MALIDMALIDAGASWKIFPRWSGGNEEFRFAGQMIFIN